MQKVIEEHFGDDKSLNLDLLEKTNTFRQRVRKDKIPSFYWGPGHVLFNASLLFGSSIFYLIKLDSPLLLDFLPFLFVFLIGNMAVFFIHKYPLHGRYWWNAYAYSNHTRIHHVFYTKDKITFRDSRDWYTMFFPPEVVAAFILLYHPFFYFTLKPVIGPNATYAYLMASSLYFILYEIVHYCSHLPSGHFMLKLSFFKKMRRHHQLHHDPKLMGKYNFCIVYPLFDHLMGTYVDDKRYKELTGNEPPGSGDFEATV